MLPIEYLSKDLVTCHSLLYIEPKEMDPHLLLGGVSKISVALGCEVHRAFRYHSPLALPANLVILEHGMIDQEQTE